MTLKLSPAANQSASIAKRETLAVVLMTRNEEARLAACLDHVKGWTDEIVIIDDLSTDGTIEVARRYTDKIFSYACEDDHCQQWNRGIEHATADWILHLDADEWVTPQLKQAIDRVLREPSSHSAYEIIRKNFFLGHPMRYGGFYHRHLVFFRRSHARCVGHGVHPAARLVVDGSIGFLDAEVEHYPFASIAQYVARQNHYTSVEARSMLDERGRLPLRHIIFQAAVRPFKLFWKYYVKKKGYRDGWHGLVFCLLYVFVHFMVWVKYWELLYVGSAQEIKG